LLQSGTNEDQEVTNRRQFIQSTATAGILAGTSTLVSSCSGPESLFSISLAQWSLNRRIFNGDLDALDFPVFTAQTFGIQAVEYVNQFFMDRAEDRVWLGDLRRRCDDNGVMSLLIMCDREGNLGDPDDAARTMAVENHYKWVEAAEYLDCHSVRVNAGSAGTWDEQRELATDGLRRLSEFAADYGLNVIVENHGGLSSNGQWLSEVISGVGLDNCGTLPDFGNFRVGPNAEYDKYLGVEQLMPYPWAALRTVRNATSKSSNRITGRPVVMPTTLAFLSKVQPSPGPAITMSFCSGNKNTY